MAAAPGEAGQAAAELAANVANAHTAAPSRLHPSSSLTITNAQPLGSRTRAVLQRYFDRDLSMVRVHTGRIARRMNEALEAEAFTVGSDIYLRSEEGAGDDPSSIALLGHEVSHVLQQGSQPVRRFIQRAAVQREIEPASLDELPPSREGLTAEELKRRQAALVIERVYSMAVEELRLELERNGS